MRRYLIFPVALLGSALAQPVAACDATTQLTPGEMKEYRDRLEQADADPIDRLVAYRRLACSDDPILRSYAIRVGLKSARDPLLRQQIAFDALMAMPRIDLELSDQGLGRQAREFVKRHGTLVVYNVAYRNREAGCISLYYNSMCSEGYAVTIKGDKLLYNVVDLVGTLELVETGEFIGAVRYKGEPIAARIKVF
ncbi:hypothetical protein [Stappia sp.]|uniref:hypothetical protein n=1 Tax=Stappia sp. TaxID=1870903 RepID=UPI0032D90E80